MMKLQRWLAAGLALSTVGILAGCSTTGQGTTSSRRGTNNTTNNQESGTSPTSNVTIKAAESNSSSNATVTYKTYTNQRFGFSVEYPSTWQMSPRPNDGDGRWFTTPSGVESFDNGYGSRVPGLDVILAAGGNSNVVNGSSNGYDFKQMVSEMKKSVQYDRKQQGFVSETLTVVPNKWIVDTKITKVGHGGIEYSKTYVTLITDQGVSMTFPKIESNVYLPIWNYVAKTFQPGNKPG